MARHFDGSTATPPTSVSAQYDLGGGASVNGGVRQTYDSWPRRRRGRRTRRRSPTSVSRWRSDPGQRDGERERRASARLFLFGLPHEPSRPHADPRGVDTGTLPETKVPTAREATMKLLATTVSGALLIAGGAAAQGIALFGDARLGLGYNIDNDGGVLVDDDGDTPDDLRAISPRPLRRQPDRRDRQRHHLRRLDPRRQRRGRRGRRGRPDRRRGLRLRRLGHAELRRRRRRRPAVGRRRPGQLLADRPDRHQRDPLRLERRQLRPGRRLALRREPVRPPDGALRLRLRELRLLALDQPRPDRHRRRRRLRRRLRRRQLERRRRLLQVRLVRQPGRSRGLRSSRTSTVT